MFDGRRIGGPAEAGSKADSPRTPEIAQLGIAYVPENMGIFADLTVRENMLLAARAGAARGASSTRPGSSGCSASSRR